ncbi:hypothetical protein Tco_0936401 [Tanacetum coccineum]
MGKALDVSLVVTKSNETELEKQDTNSRSRNDADADNANIRPIYDEEQMAEVQLTVECNIFATGQQHTEQPEIITEGRVDKYTEQCQVKIPMLNSSLDSKTTECSSQSLKSKTIEQTTSLLANNADLKAQIQEKVFAIAALKNDLRKLKRNSVDTKFAKILVLGKLVLQSLRNHSVVRQLNAFKSERPQMSKPQFASQVDVINNLSRPVTQHSLPKRRESNFEKPDHMIASSESRNSSKNMPRFSSNNMVHNYYLDEARKKIQEIDRNSKTSVMLLLDFKALLMVANQNLGVLITQLGVCLWIPTGKLFDSCTGKDDSELTHGSNVDILNIHECKQTLDLSAGTSINVQKEQSFDLSAVNGENQVVSKSSVVTTADASDKCQ